MSLLNQPLKHPAEKANVEIKCPQCESTAIYKYGKTSAGSRRYLCLICNRQFTRYSHRTELKSRPQCPVCGNTMHVYMRGNQFIRFRCSNYPACKTFKKVILEDA